MNRDDLTQDQDEELDTQLDGDTGFTDEETM
jgi:hypothetical protein